MAASRFGAGGTAAATDASRADSRKADSEARLVALIRDEIRAAPGRRITFARFMQLALTAPSLGYYATSDRRPTREGDFVTAPELHPLFGRCLARFVEAVWRMDGGPAEYRVREWGAGRGQLRASVVGGLQAEGSPLSSRLRWELVDMPARSDASGRPANIVIANEYLDALPVHRLVRRTGALREAWVTWHRGWFAETLGDLSTDRLAAHLEDDGIELREGQRAEVSLATGPAVETMAAGLAQDGLLLVIDYGHDAAELYGPRRMAGSLLTYRHQRVGDDPFAAVGRTDITSHVDLTALERAAADAQLRPVGRTTQGRFLAELGLGELLFELGRRPATDPAAYLEARSAVARLMDPRHLGGFAVLAWRPAAGHHAGRDPAPLPGFRSA